MAGSYDNEAIAIFLLMFTFYLWIKALKTGSAFYSTLAAMFYGWMVAAWGGYVFITNMVPLHVFVLILMGRFSNRIYTAYSSWYVIGTLASMQVPFVGFLPVRTSEHMAALGECIQSNVAFARTTREVTLIPMRSTWHLARRRVRTVATRRLCARRSSIGTGQAVPVPLEDVCRTRVHRRPRRARSLDYERVDRTVDGQILLSLGHGVCQDSQ